jgi:dsRNA-specific ribonuclease
VVCGLQSMNFRSKTLADLVEAFIGAAFVAGGVEGGLNFLDYHNICKRPTGQPKGTSTLVASNVPRWSATLFVSLPEQLRP